MSGALPIVIDPLDLAKSGSRLVGQFRLSEMPRLRPFSPSDSAVAEVDLGFAQSDPDVARLTGHIKVSLQLTCQRCLQPMVLSLDLEPEIYFDGSGTAADELDNRDLINLADGRELDFMGLVEDEVLLALPMIPMHAPEECQTEGRHGRQPDRVGRADNPFAKLAELKPKRDK